MPGFLAANPSIANQSTPSPFIPQTPPSAPAVTATSPIKTTVPVVTAQAAQDDYQAKSKAFNELFAKIQAQTDTKVRSELMAQEAQAAKEVNDAKSKLDQQSLNIQQTQADAQNTTAQAKLAAAGSLSGTTTSQKSAPDSTGQDIGDAAQGGIGATLNNFNEQMGSISSAQEQLAQKSVASLQNLLQGTIPLSAPQQALITSLQTQLQQNVLDQTKANQSLVGTLTESQFRSGGEYTPDQMAGSIHNAISVGTQKIQALDNAAALTIANLEQGFKKDNYSIINQQYSILDKQLSDKASAIQSTYDKTISAIKDYRDNQQKQVQDAITNQLNSDKFDYQQVKDVIDQAHAQGVLTEQVRHNKMAELDAANRTKLQDQSVATQQGELKLKQNAAATGTGSDGMGILSGASQTTMTGKQYVDSSQFKGAAYNQAQKQAAALGIPFINKDNADTLTEIDKARLNQKTINDYVHQFLPQDAQGRILAGPQNKLSEFLQTDDQIAAYNSFRTSAIGTLKALAGTKGLRINEKEILMATANDIPKITDTIGRADQIFKNISAQLTNGENSILVSNRSTLVGEIKIQDPKTGEVKTFPAGTDVDAATKAGYKVIK